MKRFLILTLVFSFGILTTGGAGNAFAQGDPSWWGDTCDGCWFKEVWTNSSGIECQYNDCGTNGCGDIAVEVVGNTVTVTVWNKYVPINDKRAMIRVEGTGATGDPESVVVQGKGLYGNPDSDAPVHNSPPLIGIDGATWYVEVDVSIHPQPDRVVLTFDVPGAPVVGEVWAWECCTRQEHIPTVSEWGLIVMALLLMTAGTVVIGRRRPAAA